MLIAVIGYLIIGLAVALWNRFITAEEPQPLIE